MEGKGGWGRYQEISFAGLLIAISPNLLFRYNLC